MKACWLWMRGINDTLAELRPLGMAARAAGFAYSLPDRFLLAFIAGRAPVLVMLLRHRLP